jgi:hypothetical protein
VSPIEGAYGSRHRLGNRERIRPTNVRFGDVTWKPGDLPGRDRREVVEVRVGPDRVTLVVRPVYGRRLLRAIFDASACSGSGPFAGCLAGATGGRPGDGNGRLTGVCAESVLLRSGLCRGILVGVPGFEPGTSCPPG